MLSLFLIIIFLGGNYSFKPNRTRIKIENSVKKKIPPNYLHEQAKIFNEIIKEANENEKENKKNNNNKNLKK